MHRGSGHHDHAGLRHRRPDDRGAPGDAGHEVRQGGQEEEQVKTLSLKLKSSEAITKIGAQLLKGKKVVGTGKLASLNGTGTLKLKLKSKLKKGSYTLNLVGNRASGERATAAFKLKAK